MSPTRRPAVPYIEALRAVYGARTLTQLAATGRKEVATLFPARSKKKVPAATGEALLSLAQERRMTHLKEILLSHVTHCQAALRRKEAAPDSPPVTLTEREGEILAMISRGETDRAVGRALEISTRTVSKHVEHVLKKLKVPSAAPAKPAALAEA